MKYKTEKYQRVISDATNAIDKELAKGWAILNRWVIGNHLYVTYVK